LLIPGPLLVALTYGVLVLPPIVMLGLPMLTAMILIGYRAWRGDSVAMIAVLLLTAVWLRVDKRFEGPLLLDVSRNHGLVLGDVVGLLVLTVAGVGWLRTRLPRSLDKAGVA
jgi:hypothetical protein